MHEQQRDAPDPLTHVRLAEAPPVERMDREPIRVDVGRPTSPVAIVTQLQAVPVTSASRLRSIAAVAPQIVSPTTSKK